MGKFHSMKQNIQKVVRIKKIDDDVNFESIIRAKTTF
jgi:hypothetical protein